MCHQRNWLDLPKELINLVSKKLPKLSDFVKFRVVCKTWCSSAPLFNHSLQLPWLIEHRPGSHLVNGLCFYSSFSGETGTIFRKEFNHRTNCMRLGPSHGSLLLDDRSINTHSYILFNPLTDEKIYLPPLHFSKPCLVWTGTNPTRNSDVIVIEQSKSMKNGSLAFYDRGNNDWIVSHIALIFSICYFRGMLFWSDAFYYTYVYDVFTKKILYTIPPPEDVVDESTSEYDFDDSTSEDVFYDSTIYLVESAGEILMVSLNFERWEDYDKTVFRIYKLAFDGRSNPVCWVKIYNIDDQMLFLDARNGFSISSKSFPEHRGNCIYFLYANHMPCRYNIEDGKIERLCSPFVLHSSWFVPDLR